MRSHRRSISLALVFGLSIAVLGVALVAAYPGRPPRSLPPSRPSTAQVTSLSQTEQPATPSGHVWWSGRGNHLTQMLITRTLSLVGAVAPITLSFTTRYDMEAGSDFGHVEVLTAATYSALPVRSGGQVISVDSDPFGQPVPNGLTGQSIGWIRADTDLSAFAGKSTRLRFRYVTDDGGMYDGWWLDDLEIRDAHGVLFHGDVESGPDGWAPEPAGGWRIVEPGEWMLPLGPNGEARPGQPGTNVEHPVTLWNASGGVATLDLAASGPWPTEIRPNRVTLGPGAVATITLEVSVPPTATLGDVSRTEVRAGLSPTITNQVAVDTYAGSGKYGYVTDYYGHYDRAPFPGEDEVAIFDRESHRRVGKLLVGPGTPAFLALSPDRKHLYVSLESSGEIVTVDTARNVVTGRMRVGESNAPGKPWPMAVSPQGLLYVLDYSYGGVWVVDPDRQEILTLIQGLDIPDGGWWDLALSPDGTKLYVAAIRWTESGFDPYPLTVLDLEAGRTTTVDTGLVSPLWVSASPDGREVYVVSPVDNKVAAVDAASLAVRTVVLSAPPASIGGFRAAFSPDGRLAYVPRGVGALRTLDWPREEGQPVVSVIDRAAATEVTTITVGANPAGMAISPDGRQAYVANASDGTVSEIDLNLGRTERSFPVGNTLMDVAVGRGDYRLYLPMVEKRYP